MESAPVSFDHDRAEQIISSEVGGVRLEATNIRRERTGIHGRVCIYHQDEVTYDNFNLDRREDRARLIKTAYSKFDELSKTAFPPAGFERSVDLFCAEIFLNWEASQFAVVTAEADPEEKNVRYYLRPYGMIGAGAILYAREGMGKSYLLQTMAVCRAHGDGRLWPVQRGGALYINLERDGQSLTRREYYIRRALGLTEHSQVAYLHARGWSLRAVQRAIRAYVAVNPDAVLFLDSISRSDVGGSLIDDETANNWTNLMNSLGRSWFAVGHTAKTNSDEVFGSVHWMAGADLGIKLTSERNGQTLGLALEVTKANDIAYPPISYLALEFTEPNDDGDSHLVAIRSASRNEFPGIEEGRKRSVMERLRDYVEAHGETRAEDAIRHLQASQSQVNRLLNSPDFEVARYGPRGAKYYVLRDLDH